MKNINLLSVLMLSILLLGCGTDKKKNGFSTLEVSISGSRRNIILNDIASKIRYIPLETNDSLIIGEIVKVIKKDNYYFISDATALYKFDQNGKLAGYINKKGNGPDEYIGISDFQIDKEGGVWILGRNKKILNNYSWAGELLKQIHLKYWIQNFIFNDRFIYMYCGNEVEEGNDSKIHVWNIDTEEYVAKFLRIDKNQSNYLHILSQLCFIPRERDIYFFQAFNDTIYKLSPEAIQPYAYINLDDKNIPASFYKQKYENIVEFFNALMNESYAYGIPYFYEYPSYYLLSFYYNRQQYMAILPKSENEESFVSSHCRVGDDILPNDFKMEFSDTQTFLQNDGSLIFILNPMQIDEYAKNKNNKNILRTLQITDSEQNPVLLDVELE